MLDALEFRFTPKQILETEDIYPGLWEDISIELWQRKIIDAQVNGEG